MKKSVLLILLFAASVSGAVLVYFLFSASPPPETLPRQKLVAMVNGEPITAAAFVEKYERFSRRANISTSESSSAPLELKMGFLNRLIETHLLLQEAEVRGLTVTEEELNREIGQLKEDYPKDTLNETLERIGLNRLCQLRQPSYLLVISFQYLVFSLN